MLPGAQASLFSKHGVGARAGLAHAVLDVGQGAHGELQAVGQIGAVAVAQRDAPTHDVVAEPFQGASVHRSIMTHEGSNVESPYPFLSTRCTDNRSYFLGTPARSALTWVIVSQEGFLHLLLGQADHLHLGIRATSRRTTFGLGERLAGPPFLVAAPSMATSAKPAGTPRSRAPGLRSVATVKHVTVEVVSVLLT